MFSQVSGRFATPAPRTPIPAVRHLRPHEVVFGSSSSGRFRDITPEQLIIEASPGTPKAELQGPRLEQHLRRFEELHRHAQRAKARGNFCNRHFAAGLSFTVGHHRPLWEKGINVEPARDITPCDLGVAYYKAIDRVVDQNLQGPVSVQDVYLINADPETIPPVPCADCHRLLTSDGFQPETLVIGLQQDKDGQYRLNMRTVGEMLPLHKRTAMPAFTTDKVLGALPVQMSDTARHALSQENAPTEQQLQTLLGKALQAHRENAANDLAKKPLGAAVGFSPVWLNLAGGRLDWSTRWSEYPDRAVVHRGLETLGRLQEEVRTGLEWLARTLPTWLAPLGTTLKEWLAPLLAPPKVTALAYYGDLPPIGNLGRFCRQLATPDTPLITVENDAIQIRTIRDYMPELYSNKN